MSMPERIDTVESSISSAPHTAVRVIHNFIPLTGSAPSDPDPRDDSCKELTFEINQHADIPAPLSTL